VQIHYLNNAKVPSLHAAFRALNLSESAGESPELARNYAHAAVFTGLLMLHRAARGYARRARAMAERVGQPSCTAYVEFIRGVYWVTVGAWEDAVADLSTAMRMTDAIGERRRWYESGFTLANALSRRGDLAASAELSGRLLEAGRRRGVPQVRVWGAGWQAWCLLALDPDGPRLGELEAELADCLASHPTIPLADQILGYGILAVVWWRRGKHAEARAAADAADGIMTRTNQIAHYLPPAYAGLAEVYAGVWAADPAAGPEMRRRLRRLKGTLGGFRLMYPIGGPTAELVRGWYHLRRGRPGRAVRRWRAAAASAERFRMPYEEALAHAELARHLPAAAAEPHRDRARELFTKAGAVADLRRLDVPGG
jgi:tetratricopeptide (TPR) repeat protein